MSDIDPKSERVPVYQPTVVTEQDARPPMLQEQPADSGTEEVVPERRSLGGKGYTPDEGASDYLDRVAAKYIEFNYGTILSAAHEFGFSERKIFEEFLGAIHEKTGGRDGGGADMSKLRIQWLDDVSVPQEEKGLFRSLKRVITLGRG